MKWLWLFLIVAVATATGCARSLPYYISLDAPSPSQAVTGAPTPPCTLYLGKVIDEALNDARGNGDPYLAFDIHQSGTDPVNAWDIRKVQVRVERRIQDALDRLRQLPAEGPSACAPRPEMAFDLNYHANKWLAVYSLDNTDPDQDVRRLEEYVRSMGLIKRVVEHKAVVADQSPGEWTEPGPSNLSWWCGSEENCGTRPDSHSLHRIHSVVNARYLQRANVTVPNDITAIDQLLLRRIQHITEKGDRTTRLVVLGYEIPWDKDETSIRYAAVFLFEEKLQGLDTETFQLNREPEREFLGYSLFYANEATPEPESPTSATNDPELPGWRRAIYMTGYPVAVAIGMKNAAFELAKIPFSMVGGLIAGRDYFWEYPWQNFKTAWNTLELEASTLPSHGLPLGLFRLLGEVPLVGQLFHVNTGPTYPDSDELESLEEAKRKIFLSRGIYGGNKWGQDTGLWASWMRMAYPTYEIYAPPYRHGTVTDVVWSMFNLSHGPAYNEALYIQRHAGRRDHLYLSGHSGGVQRSAAASRILKYHGYSVMKVVGIAGPSIGQAYVDSRYPNAFQVFLNTQSGANQDIVSKVGLVAGTYSSILDFAVLRVPKFVVGGIAGVVDARWREKTYQLFDHMGYTNAVTTEITRKISAQHATPLRLSLTEPIVLDAYVRSELANAFREDLARPDHNRFDGLLDQIQKKTVGPEKPLGRRGPVTDDEGKGAVDWLH